MFAICQKCGKSTRNPKRGNDGETLCPECREKENKVTLTLDMTKITYVIDKNKQLLVIFTDGKTIRIPILQ